MRDLSSSRDPQQTWLRMANKKTRNAQKDQITQKPLVDDDTLTTITG